MKHSVLVKEYTRKRHGRAKFGGKVKEHHITIQKRTRTGSRDIVALPAGDMVRLANKIVSKLRPVSKKISIAGSIRRGKTKGISDIDIVVIPKSIEGIQRVMSRFGTKISGGEYKMVYSVNGATIELYITKPESWGATLFYATGPGGANIGRRALAKQQGLLLNRWGVFDRRNHQHIAGRTEREVYSAIGREYKNPKDRV